jgi:hypothetical protein
MRNSDRNVLAEALGAQTTDEAIEIIAPALGSALLKPRCATFAATRPAPSLPPPSVPPGAPVWVSIVGRGARPMSYHLDCFRQMCRLNIRLRLSRLATQ